VTDDDTPAAPVLFGQLAYQVDVHRLGRVADVEMNVDIDIEFTGECEDPPDLAVMVAVVAWGAADYVSPAFQRFEQQLLSAGIVGQPVLRENTDFDVDCPFIIGDQRMHPFEAAQSDRGVHFDLGAHPCRAIENALSEGALGPVAHILGGELLLQRRHLLHWADLATPLMRTRSMMRICRDGCAFRSDRQQAFARIISFRGDRQTLLDRNDLPAGDANVHQLTRKPASRTLRTIR
jgi:hypothetical protein